MAFGNLEGTAGQREMDRASAVGEWKRALATAIVWCAAVLFAGGVAVGLRFGGGAAYWLWQDHQQKQAALREAHRDCPGRFDPQEWGTPRQQFDSCVSDRMEPWTLGKEVHPLILVFVVVPWAVYMGITGLTMFLVWDYRRDRWGRATSMSVQKTR